jgi:hypothetical protein
MKHGVVIVSVVWLPLTVLFVFSIKILFMKVEIWVFILNGEFYSAEIYITDGKYE